MTTLPNFMIIGAPKAGTTALFYWLANHPEVHLSVPKEPFFFEDRSEYEKGSEYYWRSYFAAGYRGQPSIGEARTAHLWLPYVTRRIKETVPDVRLVVILRNPVWRAFSHWWMMHTRGHEPLGFDNALRENINALNSGRSLTGPEAENIWRRHIGALAHQPDEGVEGLARPYLEPGYYAAHIERYLAWFPRSRMCVLLHDDLIESPRETMKKLCRFLSLDSTAIDLLPKSENVALTEFSAPLFRLSRRMRLERLLPRTALAAARNTLSRIGSRPALTPESLNWLQRHYAPHNRRLEALLSRDLSIWN